METAVPDSIVCRQEIEEYDTSLLAYVEGIFDVLGDEGHLISLVESRLAQWVDDRVETSMQEALHELVWHTEEGYWAVSLGVI